MKTWGEMTKEEKIEIFSAFLDGKEIESLALRYENDKLVKVWGNACMRLFWDEIPLRVKE